MLTFVALGDSTTEGYGDKMPDGRWRGWAALLADALPARLHNVARSGAVAGDVVERQLPAALAHRPDLAAVLIGVNDTLRHTFDVAAIGAALDHTVGSLRAAGAQVLTGCLPDPGRMLRLPSALARPLGRRVRAVNSVTHAVAARHGTIHLHIPHLPSAYDPLMWSVDRLHPGERGHRLLAGGYFDLLRAAGLATGERPHPEPVNPPPTPGASVWWMATRGTKWVFDRSTDLVPYLARMAAAEWWYGLRGAADRLDERVQADIGAALARLAGNGGDDPVPAADAGSALERAAF